MSFRNNLIITGFCGAVAVSLGALGAHWLKARLSTGLITPEQLIGFDTAVKYQMYHTLAMLIVVLLSLHLQSRYLKWAFNCFLTGIFLFSGSLYILCTRNLYHADFLKVLGPVTPIGGLFFVAGWLLLAFSAAKKNPVA